MMHVMMVLTGKMKTDKNFLYPNRFCERVCQSWAIAPIRWRGDQGEGGFNNVSDVNDDDTGRALPLKKFSDHTNLSPFFERF